MGNRFFNVDSSKFKKATKNANGFLVIPEVIIGKCGVFPYRNDDGSIRYELRHPDDVLAQESLDTLKNVAVCFEHPKDSKGNYTPVTSENAKELNKGLLGDKIEVVDGSKIKGSVVITHEDLIKKIEEEGVREVSGGYLMDLEKESGVYKGQKYDFRQRNIRYNHLAVTIKGRQGSDVALRLDSDDAIESHIGENMEEIEVNGEKFQVPSQVAAHIKSLVTKAGETEQKKDEAEQKAADSEKEKLELKSDKEKAEARADSLDADLKTAQEEIKTLKEKSNDTARLDSLASERVEILTLHKRLVRGDSRDNATKTNDDLKREVVKACYPKVDLEGKSEVYVQARFDSIIEKDETALETIEKNLSKANFNADSNPDNLSKSELARRQARNDSFEAGRKPLK